ncbi:MAG: ATP phosphoribosyltransferase regulatory subunit, partial [Deltaproteobacteria bacterium]|nr:ATP phosphoribosyltransferase regulatory subunit [Deltaproteobacteria bacterium]
MDKIERSADGMQAVKNLLAEKIGKKEKIASLFDCLLTPEKSNNEVMLNLKKVELKSDLYNSAIFEIEQVYNYLIELGCNDDDIKIDISIVRGLDYYTGTVFETFLLGHEKSLGSICSGGRYDDLADFFIEKKLPGVG